MYTYLGEKKERTHVKSMFLLSYYVRKEMVQE